MTDILPDRKVTSTPIFGYSELPLPFQYIWFDNFRLIYKRRKKREIEMDRDNWGSKAEFLLACIGYCVGLGNLWRFPYLVYESGGGVFLIPYFIMLFLVGIPLLYMELSIGLITQRGPVHSIKALCPFFKGNLTFRNIAPEQTTRRSLTF